MSASASRCVLAGLTFAVILTAGAAGGQELPKNVKVTLVCILASDHPDQIDPRLAAIAKEVQLKNPNLKSFKIKCMGSRSLPVNKTASFELLGEQRAEVTIKQPADDRGHVVLTVKPPLQGAIEYETVCGKFLPIVTRYETSKGERLILAIRVQPCNGGNGK